MTRTSVVKLEKATAQDYPEIVTVWEESVRATHHFLKEKDILFFKALLQNEYLNAVNLICTHDERENIEAFLGTSADKIQMLFIHPTARGKGIGKILLQYAVEKLGIKKVDVNEQNQQAVGLYAHLGFKIINRLDLDGMGKPYPILNMALK
jgi:putative acetyltransferase